VQTLSTGSRVTQLPLFNPPPASPRDVDFHAISRPARAFTGDFYFTHRHDNHLWVVVGDVAGKGVQAAVVMGMIQEELEHRIETCAETECDPAVTMTRLDLFLRGFLPGNRFATVVIARIHDDGFVSIANGGHPPVLIARRDGTIETVGSTGPVIGLLPSPKWRSVELPFRHGDTLLAYTDGVIESRSNSEDEFGIPRLSSAFALASARHSAREVGDALAAIVDAHGTTHDDVTLIVARR
jgi:serine phosphatase RsbU (regulator of sigma subunit)